MSAGAILVVSGHQDVLRLFTQALSLFNGFHRVMTAFDLDAADGWMSKCSDPVVILDRSSASLTEIRAWTRTWNLVADRLILIASGEHDQAFTNSRVIHRPLRLSELLPLLGEALHPPGSVGSEIVSA